MGLKSSIEWTESTWNPVTGCTKISPGCKHCYAERMAGRLKAMGQRNYRNGFTLTLQEQALELPLKWKKPQRIFVNSMSDLFHADVPFPFIQQTFDVMRRAHWHQFQVLTKPMQQVLTDVITAGTPRESMAAYEFTYQLSEGVYDPFHDRVSGPDADAYWSDICSRILQSCAGCLDRLAAKYLFLAITAYEQGDVPITKVLEWHGVNAIFGAAKSRLFQMWWPPLVMRIINRGRWRDGNPRRHLHPESELAGVGRFLASTPPPWVTFRKETGRPSYRMFAEDSLRERESSDAPASQRSPEGDFAIFSMAAVLLEQVDERERPEVLTALRHTGLTQSRGVIAALSARFEHAYLAEWRLAEMPEPYRSRIDEWITSAVSFVRTSGQDKRGRQKGDSFQIDLELESSDEEN